MFASLVLCPTRAIAPSEIELKLKQPACDDAQLLSEFEALWIEANHIWEQYQDTAPFHNYVSADYRAIFAVLCEMRGSFWTVLEWGSGLGVVTIMASRMGFDACGIEAEQGLVDRANILAEKYGAKARFAHGSFVPDQFVWDPADGDEVHRTIINVPDAYDELDMELRDFDLVYAYPWPDEHSLYRSIMRQFGASHATMLTYDVREGLQRYSVRKRQKAE